MRVEDGDGGGPVGALGPGHHAQGAVPGTQAVQEHSLLQAHQEGLSFLLDRLWDNKHTGVSSVSSRELYGASGTQVDRADGLVAKSRTF